ncbi:ergothioneine biosynthesis protein EgtC [Rhodococcus sp. ARC_M6]|uniref:ergothioneine biosynthesis protein EgtC n=1 Tax=Rhodococcus sp. ARC_M6 TaxID=2928852 RepID=UPI001FB343B7|nr:ergothioneine biosynthesis protein EgtC [Rhodococcus sp. ARC_M6]MCJ0904066.1 ergothioneine biosynthesis protein EgtC [Rhodococcus sp. ARC_M6]
MCRHLGYVGPVTSVRDLLHFGSHSLVRQSWAPKEMRGGGTINADGFGAAWWSGGVLGRYRSVSPIWSDPTVEETLSHVHSGAVIAAVRSATEGMAVEIGACAPFVDDRFALSHNGVVVRWPAAVTSLAEGIPAVQLLTMPAPTDSALLWTLLRDRLETMSPESAVATVVHDVSFLAHGSKLNLLLGDGNEMWATAWGHSLYALVDESSALIASEPLDDSPGWEQIPDRALVCARPGHLIITPIQMGER